MKKIIILLSFIFAVTMSQAQVLQISDLKPGDVLLYHGHTLLSKVIDAFEHANYSHASICFRFMHGKRDYWDCLS